MEMCVHIMMDQSTVLTSIRGVDELVVCAGMGGVRVWNVASLQELLRVELPGVVCHCCCVSPSLHTIITGEGGHTNALNTSCSPILVT